TRRGAGCTRHPRAAAGRRRARDRRRHHRLRGPDRPRRPLRAALHRGRGMSLLAPLAALGRLVLGGLGTPGRLALVGVEAVSHLFRPPFYPKEFLHALMQIGWFSLPVVGMTALFTGGALALQIYAGGARFSAESVVPSIVAIGMVRELGPVLGGLMV